MRRTLISFVVALLTTAFAASTAFAADVHLKGGRNAEPAFNDLGIALAATLDISGLGNADVEIVIDATGDVTATCTNPAGATQPPGQNPADADVSGSVSIPAGAIKNGNLTATVRTEDPVTPIPGAPDCPNPQWTEDIVDLAFTSATIFVFQPPGTLVLRVDCTFASPTSDGAVSGDNVTCTQTQF